MLPVYTALVCSSFLPVVVATTLMAVSAQNILKSVGFASALIWAVIWATSSSLTVELHRPAAGSRQVGGQGAGRGSRRQNGEHAGHRVCYSGRRRAIGLGGSGHRRGTELTAHSPRVNVK